MPRSPRPGRLGLRSVFLALAGSAALASRCFIASAAETAAPPPAPAPVAAFAPARELTEYPRADAATLRVVGSSTEHGVTTVDATLAAPVPDAPPIRAWLVRPAEAKGPGAAVLWGHWLGEPETTNRSQFLAEAQALAADGVVSLLVETMWARPGWYRARKFERDRVDSLNQVVEFRRALDVLLAQPGVDPARVAFVGHDYSAMHGAILAGVDDRVRRWVFIAGTPSLLDWAFYVGKPADLAAYAADMEAVNVTTYLRHAPAGKFFLQYAEDDFYVPLPKALEYFAATPGEKQLQVYGGVTHAMKELPAIRADRTRWLRRELALPPRPE